MAVHSTHDRDLVAPRTSGRSPSRGGGMRIVDVHSIGGEASRQQRCAQPPVPKPTSLTSTRILQGVLGAALVAVLALAHIHLQFVIRDMRLQHQRMQMGYRDLLQQHAHLERQAAYLKDHKRLYAYARHELGMREITERPVAIVPSELKDKYGSVALAQGTGDGWRPKALDPANSRLRVLASARLVELLGFGKTAQAGSEVP